MRIRLLPASALAAVSLAAAAHAAQFAAYDALRTVGKAKGDTLLASLVEMRGADGDPQPGSWIMTFRDKLAPGGIREIVAGPSGIVSERTPAKPASDAPVGAMPAASLNLDSTGAFTTANREALKQKVGFDSVGYTLANKAGQPVWTVRLFDTGGLETGMIAISAKDGAIITPLRRTPPPAAATTGTPAPPNPATPSGDLGERWVRGGGLVGHVGRWSKRAWKDTSETAARVGDSIGAFFVGRPDAQNDR